MSETLSEPFVRHQHAGAEWDIPIALLETQRRWDEADAACTHLAAAGDPDAYNAARAVRLEESLALYRHPWLLEQQQLGKRYQADLAVKHLARATSQDAVGMLEAEAQLAVEAAAGATV
jgi:hypothetical protein